MRRGCESWTAALSTWLNGEVITHESQNYIQNCFCVAQMRPDFPDANRNDEDIFSDEEIDMETVELDAWLRTHAGSTQEVETGATTNEANGTADDQKKQDAMNKSDELEARTNLPEYEARFEAAASYESRLV